MVHEPTSASGAMEGGGAYNKYAVLQSGGSALALPHWEVAVRNAALDRGDWPIVIADYGSSQGKNSLAPMRLAIEILRSRAGTDRPIVVCHTDLPANDFKTLFEVLEAGPNRYSEGDANVFSCAIGRSFYQSVLPPNHVHLDWSAYSALWLSRIPTLLPGHIYVPLCTGAARDTFERQAAEDWQTFLSLRAGELRPGGRLVVVLPGAADDGLCGIEDMMNHANTVLREMVEDNSITAAEYERVVLGTWPRPRRRMLSPFAVDGRFRNLVVERCHNSAVTDPAWAVYQRDGNKEALANKHAAFIRATFAPSLASAIDRAHDAKACWNFSERLEYGLTRRLMSNPAPINLTVETMVFAKLA